MNGKRTFWLSVVAGACAGGLLSLLNKDARNYSKSVAQKTGETITHYTKNPDETVKKAKQGVQTVNDFIAQNSTSALNALKQVETTVNKFID